MAGHRGGGRRDEFVREPQRDEHPAGRRVLRGRHLSAQRGASAAAGPLVELRGAQQPAQPQQGAARQGPPAEPEQLRAQRDAKAFL